MLQVKRALSPQGNNHGFTLVELLIVIVVIGILAAVTIVAYNGVQQKATVAATESLVEQYAKGIELYYNLNGSTYPNVQTTACPDGSITCWGGTPLQANSTALAQALQPAMGKLPTIAPTQMVWSYSTTICSDPNCSGYYLAAAFPSSIVSSCPSVLNLIYINTDSANGVRNCRWGFPK